MPNIEPQTARAQDNHEQQAGVGAVPVYAKDECHTQAGAGEGHIPSITKSLRPFLLPTSGVFSSLGVASEASRSVP